jgi:hypothetical protein
VQLTGDESGAATGGDDHEDGDAIMSRHKRWADLNVNAVLNKNVGDLVNSIGARCQTLIPAKMSILSALSMLET